MQTRVQAPGAHTTPSSCVLAEEAYGSVSRDVFVLTKLDRLARSVADLMTILQALERKSVALRILNLSMDTQ